MSMSLIALLIVELIVLLLPPLQLVFYSVTRSVIGSVYRATLY